MNYLTNLTPNFQVKEFDIHEKWPVLPGFADKRMGLARLNQHVRDIAGSPIVLTSAFRSETHNAEVGGSDTSQHMKGEATDGVVWLVPLRKLAELVLENVKAGKFPAFGQIIFYPKQGHFHISLATLGNRNGEIRFQADDGSYKILTSAKQLPLWSAAQRGRGLWLALFVAVVLFFIVRSMNKPSR